MEFLVILYISPAFLLYVGTILNKLDEHALTAGTFLSQSFCSPTRRMSIERKPTLTAPSQYSSGLHHHSSRQKEDIQLLKTGWGGGMGANSNEVAVGIFQCPLSTLQFDKWGDICKLKVYGCCHNYTFKKKTNNAPRLRPVNSFFSTH